MRRTPRLRLLLSLLVLPAVLVGACGGDDEPAADSGGSTETTAADRGEATAFEPVTIDHKYGSTTVEAKPERIVVLGPQWTDVLLALDTEPVGYVVDPQGGGENGLYPWSEDLMEGSPVQMETTGPIPWEQVAGLQPDLILATFIVTAQEDYDRLAQIAPTIGPLSDREVDRWTDMLEVGGKVLGLEDEATALRQDVDQLVADTAAELPGLEGKTFAMVNYVQGDALYVVADPDDGASELFAEFGLELDPELLAEADGASGRLKLSFERVELLDSDLLVLLTNGADAASMPGYASLPAVQSGAALDLEYAPIVGLNTPSVLSIPYSLEALRPGLEAAAAAG